MDACLSTSSGCHTKEWLRENVPELLEVEQDDESALGRVRQRLIQQYGHLFVVRHGKHQMKTFPTVVKDSGEDLPGCARTSSSCRHFAVIKEQAGNASFNVEEMAAWLEENAEHLEDVGDAQGDQFCIVADTLFEIADVDDDGSLNFPEFVAVSRQHNMRGEASNLLLAVHAASDGFWNVLGGVFKGFVSGALGNLGKASDSSNLRRILGSVTFDWSSLDKKALHQTLKRLFDQMDKNHDQKVSYEELAGIFQGALSTEEVKRAFSRIDLHGTNYLTFEELDTFLFSALSAEDMETLGS
eukprot:s454_g14.t2